MTCAQPSIPLGVIFVFFLKGFANCPVFTSHCYIPPKSKIISVGEAVTPGVCCCGTCSHQRASPASFSHLKVTLIRTKQQTHTLQPFTMKFFTNLIKIISYVKQNIATPQYLSLCFPGNIMHLGVTSVGQPTVQASIWSTWRFVVWVFLKGQVGGCCYVLFCFLITLSLSFLPETDLKSL